MISFPPVDVSGAADPKLTLGLASIVAAWDAGEGVSVLVNGEPLVEFAGDVFGTMTDGQFILASSFKNVTYDLPDGIETAQVSIEIIAPDNDQLVGVDSIRISDGPIEGLEIYQPPTPNSFQQGVNGYTGTVDHELWSFAADRTHPVFETNSLLQDLGSRPAGDIQSDLAQVLSLQVDGGGEETHVLIRFEDIFGEDGIPLDAEIESATLTFEAFDRGDRISLHRMLEAWDLEDTWNTTDAGIQPGVEAQAEAESRSGDEDIEIGPVSFDVTESLRLFQTNPDENFGWVLLPSGSDGNTFLASEVHQIPDDLIAALNASQIQFTQIVPQEHLAPILQFVLSSEDCSDNYLVGDFDCNGKVEFADFLTLSANFGMPGDGEQGDTNGDGEVNFTDFLTLSANFEMMLTASPVPEPASGLLITLASLLTVCVIRKRRR